MVSSFMIITVQLTPCIFICSFSSLLPFNISSFFFQIKVQRFHILSRLPPSVYRNYLLLTNTRISFLTEDGGSLQHQSIPNYTPVPFLPTVSAQFKTEGISDLLNLELRGVRSDILFG
ncbi:unnamed protein product [Cuscuta epithymum]|uniref:Uncharacterized protein n=1 Tax=Cuscuta epithymum TaxID=186058 RepID=A0AAV0GH39_9ASTE|nr:unnamed protein product [Cuscuta epithymum]